MVIAGRIGTGHGPDARHQLDNPGIISMVTWSDLWTNNPHSSFCILQFRILPNHLVAFLTFVLYGGKRVRVTMLLIVYYSRRVFFHSVKYCWLFSSITDLATTVHMRQQSRVATFTHSQSGTGVWELQPTGVWGHHPRKTFGIVCDLMHFCGSFL